MRFKALVSPIALALGLGVGLAGAASAQTMINDVELTDEQIPLQAKIVSVADTFDAMTIDRPYSKGMLLPEAIERIRSFVGTRYSSDVVEALVRGCEKGEIGKGVVKFMNENQEASAAREELLKNIQEMERRVA